MKDVKTFGLDAEWHTEQIYKQNQKYYVII